MQKKSNFFRRLESVAATVGLAASLSLISLPTLASYDVNIPQPASPIATQIYSLHMYLLGVCATIFVVVFAFMFYSIFKFRKSNGAKPDVNFHESTTPVGVWLVQHVGCTWSPNNNRLARTQAI